MALKCVSVTIQKKKEKEKHTGGQPDCNKI